MKHASMGAVDLFLFTFRLNCKQAKLNDNKKGINETQLKRTVQGRARVKEKRTAFYVFYMNAYAPKHMYVCTSIYKHINIFIPHGLRPRSAEVTDSECSILFI